MTKAELLIAAIEAKFGSDELDGLLDRVGQACLDSKHTETIAVALQLIAVSAVALCRENNLTGDELTKFIEGLVPMLDVNVAQAIITLNELMST